MCTSELFDTQELDILGQSLGLEKQKAPECNQLQEDEGSVLFRDALI